MDELDVLASMRADLPPPHPARLASIRAGLSDAPIDRRRARSRLRPRLRPVLVGAAAAALVAAGCAAVLATRSPHSTGPVAGPDDRTIVVSSTPAPGSSPGPARFVNAAQLLDSAATYALADARPLAGQFRYVRQHSTAVSQIVGERAVDVFSDLIDENWISPDPHGKSYERQQLNLNVHYLNPQDKAYLDANAPSGAPRPATYWLINTADGQSTQVYPPATSPTCADCTTQSAWAAPTLTNLAALPRDTVGLRASLYRYAQGELSDGDGGKPVTVDDLAYQSAAGVLGSPLVSDQLRAALYQVTKTIPGITLKGSLANFDGVRGIAISRTDSFGVELDLIFDQAGGSFIGERTVSVRPDVQLGLPAGTVLNYSAVTTEIATKPVLPAGATAR